MRDLASGDSVISMWADIDFNCDAPVTTLTPVDDQNAAAGRGEPYAFG
jgi:hypothetical protein